MSNQKIQKKRKGVTLSSYLIIKKDAMFRGDRIDSSTVGVASIAVYLMKESTQSAHRKTCHYYMGSYGILEQQLGTLPTF